MSQSGVPEYEQKLLLAWEEVFNRGQLTFWVLLALREGPKHMAAIRDWLGEITSTPLTVEDRSLYRALQRFYDAEMISYQTAPGERGPDRKIYTLSQTGERVLGEFIERNIKSFLQPKVVRLLKLSRNEANKPHH